MEFNRFNPGGAAMTEYAETAQSKDKTFPAMAGIPNFGFLLEANQQYISHWFEGTLALSKDLGEFAQNRVHEDMVAWSALAGCKSVEEVAECQRRFAEKATAQYSEEFGKLSQRMIGLATEGLTSLTSAATKVS